MNTKNQTALENFIKEFIYSTEQFRFSDRKSILNIYKAINYVMKKYYQIDEYFTLEEIDKALIKLGFKKKINKDHLIATNKGNINATYYNVDIEKLSILLSMHQPIQQNTSAEKRKLLEELDNKLLQFQYSFDEEN